jgi:hypothetical protein
MIELLLVWWQAKRIGRIAAERGRKPLGYQAIAVLLWFAGELVGVLAGIGIFGSDSVPVTYLFALGCALVTVSILATIVGHLPDRRTAVEQPQSSAE